MNPETAKVAPPVEEKPLTPSTLRFIDEYLIDLNGTQAYLRSHPGVKSITGRTEASRLLAIPNIQALIAEAQQERSIRTGITAEKALREAWAVATADARELVEYHITACSECYGAEPFNADRGPNPRCLSCFGKGRGRAQINDTRHLSPAAALLYAGVKVTKEGIEVKMHSKMDALEKVFKHLGLYEKDNSQKADPLTTLLATIAKSSIPVVRMPTDE